MYNTFSLEQEGSGQLGLVEATEKYFQYLRGFALNKYYKTPNSLSGLERILIKLESASELYSEFALARAGCITPHEFLFQQLVNYTYRDRKNSHYGEPKLTIGLQQALDAGFKEYFEISEKSNNSEFDLSIFKRALEVAMQTHSKILSQHTSEVNKSQRKIMQQHLSSNLRIAIKNEICHKVSHPQHDHNVHELFQHGFDMRNPYGSNLDGPWVLLSSEGRITYGQGEKELIPVFLHEEFKLHNHVDINHGANMKLWNVVLKDHARMGRPIPEKTLKKFQKFVRYETSLKNMHRHDVVYNTRQRLQSVTAESNSVKIKGNDVKTKDNDVKILFHSK